MAAGSAYPQHILHGNRETSANLWRIAYLRTRENFQIESQLSAQIFLFGSGEPRSRSERTKDLLQINGSRTKLLTRDTNGLIARVDRRKQRTSASSA